MAFAVGFGLAYISFHCRAFPLPPNKRKRRISGLVAPELEEEDWWTKVMSKRVVNLNGSSAKSASRSAFPDGSVFVWGPPSGTKTMETLFRAGHPEFKDRDRPCAAPCAGLPSIMFPIFHPHNGLVPHRQAVDGRLSNPPTVIKNATQALEDTVLRRQQLLR